MTRNNTKAKPEKAGLWASSLGLGGQRAVGQLTLCGHMLTHVKACTQRRFLNSFLNAVHNFSCSQDPPGDNELQIIYSKL